MGGELSARVVNTRLNNSGALSKENAILGCTYKSGMILFHGCAPDENFPAFLHRRDGAFGKSLALRHREPTPDGADPLEPFSIPALLMDM
jgi:hypothetical protein